MLNTHAQCPFTHITDGENVRSCKCIFYEKLPCYEKRQIKISITNIIQKGNANIAGSGTVHYKVKNDESQQLIEYLKNENKLLMELVEILKSRDK
ncbi:hypothetical protein GCM10011325_26940 [Dyadobacter sediminis]|nr:hypothetical protein GCM10011325_26940 [Dyadobacter sediminis]